MEVLREVLEMKKTITKIMVAVMCLVMTEALAACGNSGSKDTYKVSTEPTYPPFDTTNDSGDIVGFDMDLMKAIAKDQGFKVEFESLEFDALIPALKSDSTDIVIAGMNITKERSKQVDFSDSYYKTGVVLLVKKDDTAITDWNSFAAGSGLKVAAQTGTLQANIANQMKKDGLVSNVAVLNQNTTALQQLENGDVDAVLLDKPVAVDIASKQSDKYKMVGSIKEDSVDDDGIAVKKGNKELLKKINAGLKNVKENGTYDKLAKKWKIEQ